LEEAVKFADAMGFADADAAIKAVIVAKNNLFESTYDLYAEVTNLKGKSYALEEINRKLSLKPKKWSWSLSLSPDSKIYNLKREILLKCLKKITETKIETIKARDIDKVREEKERKATSIVEPMQPNDELYESGGKRTNRRTNRRTKRRTNRRTKRRTKRRTNRRTNRLRGYK
jgi:hypothetical protein